MLRFNFRLPEIEIPLLKYSIPTILVLRAVFFYLGKTYLGIVRYTSLDDIKKIIYFSFLGSLCIASANFISYQIAAIYIIPFSIVILEFLATCFCLTVARGYIMLIYNKFKNTSTGRVPVLIYGAGEAGTIAKRTIDRDRFSPFEVVAFIDDDFQKSKKKLENKPIYNSKQLEEVIQNKGITHLIVSIQKISKERLNEVVSICFSNQVQVLNVPAASSWINGELSLKQIKKVRIEDLLGREPIQLSKKKIASQLTGKVILVTGAAGSIGSEIVRQITAFEPQLILLLDQSESALYELEMELATTRHKNAIEIIIGDITNRTRMERIFKSFNPVIIYHAAAYKHVPMMEDNPSEAINTNVLGTKNLADLAVKYKVEAFVMVSTDKAVNPTNVMGASKRAAEIYTQALNSQGSTKFITTRFGNVLGSNGSVIPLFKKQIEKGGPLTVTHPEITRYFMTIPEACQLVLEAGSAGKGGEIFIFDMGKSIKIKDLASKMIKLSGFEEGKDIQVIYTGLRPGEKLYEELLNDQEKTLPTHHSQIMIANVKKYAWEEVRPKIDELIGLINHPVNDEIVAELKNIIPEYKSQNSVFEALDKKT
jgi:FlaA1/EpsC-like NDP-sugar epimerase